jgi:hypothetical protein
MKTTLREAAAVAAAGFLACLPLSAFGPARAEVLTSVLVPMDGVSLAHPCNFELLRFRGPLRVTARVTPEPPLTRVVLKVEAQAVTATGEVSGARYISTDVYETPLGVGILPAHADLPVTLHFTGPKDNFRALVVLKVTVNPDGTVTVTLGNVSLSCP